MRGEVRSTLRRDDVLYNTPGSATPAATRVRRDDAPRRHAENLCTILLHNLKYVPSAASPSPHDRAGGAHHHRRPRRCVQGLRRGLDAYTASRRPLLHPRPWRVSTDPGHQVNALAPGRSSRQTPFLLPGREKWPAATSLWDASRPGRRSGAPLPRIDRLRLSRAPPSRLGGYSALTWPPNEQPLIG